VLVAIFDAATGARVLDARVAARLSVTDQPGAEKPLERTQNADTGTYGAFFELPGHDLYIVRLIIERPLAEQPVALDFKYDRRCEKPKRGKGLT
jgi:hypothetical protein